MNISSTAAIALINDETPAHPPHLVLIKESRALMAVTAASSFKHTLREGNNVEDKMSIMEADQDDKMASHIISPDVIIPLLGKDMLSQSPKYENINKSTKKMKHKIYVVPLKHEARMYVHMKE